MLDHGFTLITSRTCNLCAEVKIAFHSLTTPLPTVEIDIEQFADKASIAGVPTLIYAENGVEVSRVAGATSRTVPSFVLYWSLKHEKFPRYYIAWTMFRVFWLRLYAATRHRGLLVTPKAVLKYRLGICATCPEAKKGRLKPDVCGICLCVIRAKALFFPSNCPMGKW